MRKCKNITLFFEYFQPVHFYKDPFYVPYYLGKLLEYSVTIVYPIRDNNKEFPKEYKGVKLVPIKTLGNKKNYECIRYIPFYNYLRKNAKDIDIFIRFFIGNKTDVMTRIYKHYNPKGKVYVKMDCNPYNIAQEMMNSSFLLLKRLLRIDRYSMMKHYNVISCETGLAYKNILQCDNSFKENLVIVPNGIDEEEIDEMHLPNVKDIKKENLMITVGRLGTYPKNTQYLLKSLDKVDLKDWKVVLIGSVEEEAKDEIEGIINSNPMLREKVILAGPIYDRKKLYEYYLKSKVFLLSSRAESFAIVFSEAKRFGNFIVSTPVGAINDIIENGKYGRKVPHNDTERFSSVIQDIIDDKICIDVYNDFDFSSLSWENALQKVAEVLK